MVDILGPQVSSSNPYGDADTLTFTAGTWQFEVSVYDGEFWSAFSTAVNVAVSAAVDVNVPAPAVNPAGAGTPSYVNGVSILVPPGSATSAAIQPWSSRPVVSSPNPYGDVDLAEILVSGQIELQVRTSDMEFTGPWSSSATITVSPNYVGRVPAQSSAAVAPNPVYLNGVLYAVPQGSAAAAAVTPFTSLLAVSSANAFGDTTALAVGQLEYQVRTADSEFWGPWSSPSVTFTSNAVTNLMILKSNGVWYSADRYVYWNSTWVRHKTKLL